MAQWFEQLCLNSRFDPRVKPGTPCLPFKSCQAVKWVPDSADERSGRERKADPRISVGTPTSVSSQDHLLLFDLLLQVGISMLKDFFYLFFAIRLFIFFTILGLRIM